MTSSNFSRPGAVDLSGLKNQAAAGAPTGGTAGSYVVDVTVQTFEEVMGRSMQYPVLVELWSPRANAEAFSADLLALSTAGEGRWLLARVNVDEQPQIAQALQVQGVPMLVAVIGGQLAPLAQGPTPKDQLQQLIDQILQAAVANGIVGRVEPTGTSATMSGDDASGESDPRFAAADAALERGDFAAAHEEFDKLVKANPNDAEAAAGRAQTGMLLRVSGIDAAEANQRLLADPQDLQANLDVADVDFASNRVEEAFDRLLDIIRQRRDEDRETARVRLLELFETLGVTDSRVVKARRALSSALF